MPTTGIRIDSRIKKRLLKNPATRMKISEKDPFGRGSKAGIYTQMLHQVYTAGWHKDLRLFTPDEQDIFFAGMPKNAIRTGIYLDAKRPMLKPLKAVITREARKHGVSVNSMINLSLVYGCYRWLLEAGEPHLEDTKTIMVASDLAEKISSPSEVAKIVSDHYADYLAYHRYFVKPPGLGIRLQKREQEIIYSKGTKQIEVYQISPNPDHLVIFLRDYFGKELRTKQYLKILSYPRKRRDESC